MAAPVLTSSLVRSNTIYEDGSTGSVPFWYFNYGLDASGAFIAGATDAETVDTTQIGIAIIGVSGITTGTVEYSTDGGFSWKTAAAAPAGQALVFKGDTLLRYTPPADANGIRTITFHAWDGTGGYNSGDIVNITAVGTGGNTPFSAATATHTLNIAPDDGHVITNFDGTSYGVGSYIDAVTGKILVAGAGFSATSTYNMNLASYNSNGSLDTTFGSGGKISLDLGVIGNDYFYLNDFEVTSAGKYLLSGTYVDVDDVTFAATASNNLLVQLNANGTLDTSFGGGDGWVKTLVENSGGYVDSGLALGLAGTSILSTTELINANFNYEFGVIKYTANGTLDTTFGGGDGIASVGFGAGVDGWIEKAIVQTDGKILAIGSLLDDPNTNPADTSALTTIVRLNADGTVDTSYGGGDGIISLDLGMGNESFVSATLLSGNSLLLAGSSTTFTSTYDPGLGISIPNYTPGDFILAKVNSSGALDTSFGGGDGIVTTDFGGSDEASIVKTLADGSILVAGTYFNDSEIDDEGRFIIAKYTASGVLDTTFGSGGKTLVYFPGDTEISDLNIQADGKIVLTGSTYKSLFNPSYSFSNDEHLVLARLNANGTLDNTFVGQNNAPVIDPTIFRIAEMFQGDVGQIVPFSYFNQGFSGTNFVNGAYDPDGKDFSQLGIAITTVGGSSITGDVTAGTIEYSTDNGISWLTHTPEVGKAGLFTGSTLLRYTPSATTSGTRTITFHTWDGTGGYTSGQKIDLAILSSTGGSSPFSANTAFHNLVIYGPTLGTTTGEVINASPSSPSGFIGGYVKALDGNDTVFGSSNNDKLDGGTGADRLYGGLGNDTFLVDTQSDLVFEGLGEGIDTVISTTSFYMYSNIENLTLATGAGTIFGSGNALSNLMQGNESNNTLLAWDGDDTVNGGAGNDIIYGINGNDTLNGEAGIDTIIGGIGNDYIDGGDNPDALYGEAGNDFLFGGTGFFTDILVGGEGDDVLDGSASASSGLTRNQGDFDFMYGQEGNDTYYVDTPSDLTFEGVTEGTDTVIADINGAGYYLYANVENLILVGNTPFGVGNALNNQLTGNSIGNYLLGGDGNDTINGKQGKDVLFGQVGTDTFIFERGTGADVIGDFVAGTDKIQISSAIYSSFAQVQANMVQNNGTTAINLGLGDLIVINGVPNASLTSADFIFA